MTLHTRIELTQEMMERFLDDIYRGDVSGFSAHKGLPDHLIYNLVCGRIHSLSAVGYRIFTGTTKTVKAKYEWLARKTPKPVSQKTRPREKVRQFSREKNGDRGHGQRERGASTRGR